MHAQSMAAAIGAALGSDPAMWPVKPWVAEAPAVGAHAVSAAVARREYPTIVTFIPWVAKARARPALAVQRALLRTGNANRAGCDGHHAGGDR